MKYFSILLILVVVQSCSKATEVEGDDNVKTGIVTQVLLQTEFDKLYKERVDEEGKSYKRKEGKDVEVEMLNYLAFISTYCAEDDPADCYHLAAFTTTASSQFGTFVVGAKLVKLASPEDIKMGVISHNDRLEFVTVDKQCVVVTWDETGAQTNTTECDVKAYTTETSLPAASTTVETAEAEVASITVDETKTGLAIKMLTLEEFNQLNVQEVQVDGKTFVQQPKIEVMMNAYVGTLTHYCVKGLTSECYTLAVFHSVSVEQKEGTFVTAARLMNVVDETHLRKCVSEHKGGSLKVKQVDGQCAVVTGVGDTAVSQITKCTEEEQVTTTPVKT